MREKVEANGKTVEEAIELALKQLDVRREEAVIEVLSHGKTGIFGFGSEPARVRATLLEGGALVQYTYARHPAVGCARLGLECRRVGFVAMNVPPAGVWRITRSGAASRSTAAASSRPDPGGPNG